MNHTVHLRFRAKRYGREGETVRTVSYDDWDPTVAGWIWPAIEQYEKGTSLAPPYLTVWDSLRHAIPGLAQVLRWRSFVSIPIPALEVDDVRNLFMDIDDTFHRIWGADRGAIRSSVVRRFISDYLLMLRPDGKLLRVKGSFVPKGRANYKPRDLISDQVSYKDGVAMQAPLGALPHANPAQLKALSRKRLQDDLQLIADACCSELEAYYEACAVLEEILTSPVDAAKERSALDKIKDRHARVRDQATLLSHEERRALTAYYLRIDNAPNATFVKPNYEGSFALVEQLTQLMGIEPDRFLRCARYRYYPHQTVLVAAVLLIQISTAWNVGSVMELTRSGIHVLERGQYLVQSIKTRTGDDTP